MSNVARLVLVLCRLVQYYRIADVYLSSIRGRSKAKQALSFPRASEDKIDHRFDKGTNTRHFVVHADVVVVRSHDFWVI